MFDVMADWMNMPLLAHRYVGGVPGRTGLQHSFIAPYGAFTCKRRQKGAFVDTEQPRMSCFL
jgi:crotonobetainyl-CoA:carnitine CoA-transferase CaiB-like acyl-CoA transferase